MYEDEPHWEIRLEDHEGNVIMFFAPNFEVTPNMQNDLSVVHRPYGHGTNIRDMQKWAWELQIQGQFLDYQELPNHHGDDLETMMGVTEPTAREQVNYLRGTALDRGTTFNF